MKKIMFTLIFLMSIQLSFSQDSFREMLLSMGASLDNEVKGQDNTYIVDTISFLCCVSNKVLDYEHIVPKIGEGKFEVKVEDMTILMQIFRQNLSAHLKRYQLDEKDNIMLDISADLSGKVRDISFSYKTEWNIPIIVIEQIEKSIKEQCRLAFDKNSPALSHARYVPYYFPIFLKDFCY